MLMCRDLARVASDYIDGQLGRADNVSIKMHLLMCRHCRTFIGNLRTSVTLIRHHSSQVIDDRYLQRLDTEINKELQAQQDS